MAMTLVRVELRHADAKVNVPYTFSGSWPMADIPNVGESLVFNTKDGDEKYRVDDRTFYPAIGRVTIRCTGG